MEKRPQDVYSDVWVAVQNRARECIETALCMLVWEEGGPSHIYYHIFTRVRSRAEEELRK